MTNCERFCGLTVNYFQECTYLIIIIALKVNKIEFYVLLVLLKLAIGFNHLFCILPQHFRL